MIPAYNKKRCAVFPFETGIHFRRKPDFFPEEDTTKSYSGFESEPARLQAEAPIKADKDIFEFVHSSKNTIDADSDEENEMNNAAPIPASAEMSDEAHFWLNGYVNKQNCRIWSEANPQVYVETPLHPEKLTVWCALWAGGILLQKR
ncbi:poly polymerase [Trichonephila clavipes]|nr:poly polymerase [Trichonephila clavipes]